jgi:hypothetical protein
MAGFTVAKLVDPAWLPVFVRKYKNREPFELEAGSKTTFVVQKCNLDILNSGDKRLIANMRFLEVKNRGTPKSYSIGKIKVTGEFKDHTKYEDDAVAEINHFIATQGGVIDVSIGGRTYPEITTALKVEKEVLKGQWGITGEVKADIILCSDATHPLFNAIFISHKATGGAKEFQQFGGVSKRSGLLKALTKNDREELNGFLRVLPGLIVNDRLVGPMMRTIKSDLLKKLAVFGTDYRPGHKSVDSVHMVGQGSPAFSKRGAAWHLTFPEFCALSGNLTPFTGMYNLVFGAQYRTEKKKNKAGVKVDYPRGFEVDGVYYKGARVGFYTEGFMRKHLVKVI